MITRRRGTAVIETEKGILVASGRKRLFLLPGGGANRGESRRRAAIRELKEETGLRAVSAHFLFTYHEPKYNYHNGKRRKIRNLHKVFLIRAEGHPRPNYHDVHHLGFWKEGSDLNLSKTTKAIIEKYIQEFRK